jgi:hypothetical protein
MPPAYREIQLGGSICVDRPSVFAAHSYCPLPTRADPETHRSLLLPSLLDTLIRCISPLCAAPIGCRRRGRPASQPENAFSGPAGSREVTYHSAVSLSPVVVIYRRPSSVVLSPPRLPRP